MTNQPDDLAADCDWGQHCALILNASVPAARRWFTEQVALPTMAQGSVAGIFYDNSMCLGQVRSQPWTPTLVATLSRLCSA